jgi:Na+/melibiose symporter-like transporter
MALLTCAVCFSPVWFLVLNKIGKRKTWLLWSLTSAVTNLLFFFVGKGMVWQCVVIAGLNGIPIGAKVKQPIKRI